MSKYQHIIEVLQANKRAMPIDAGGLQQKLTKFDLLQQPLDSDFVEQFGIENNTRLGIESVPQNARLELHTDTAYRRRSNLLINVGSHTATIQHSNNDVLETVHIEPDEHFLLDTSKPHGCDNTDKAEQTFLTINWNKQYNELQHRF